MALRITNKITRVLLLVLGIGALVGIFVSEYYDLSFEKIKQILSDLNLLRATVTTQVEPPEYSEMGLAEEKLEKLFVETPVPVGPEIREEGIVLEPESEELIEQEISPETELALMKIKVRVDEISEKVQDLDKKVKKLEALTKIEKEVKRISQEVQELSQEVRELS